MTSLAETLEFVTQADETDLEHIIDQVTMRRKNLRAITAAAVRVNSDVTLDGLSPKYLNGLTGTVETIEGKVTEIRLDTESTQKLRWASRRFDVPADVDRYLLSGVPLTTCKPNN